MTNRVREIVKRWNKNEMTQLPTSLTRKATYAKRIWEYYVHINKEHKQILQQSCKKNLHSLYPYQLMRVNQIGREGILSYSVGDTVEKLVLYVVNRLACVGIADTMIPVFRVNHRICIWCYRLPSTVSWTLHLGDLWYSCHDYPGNKMIQELE